MQGLSGTKAALRLTFLCSMAARSIYKVRNGTFLMTGSGGKENRRSTRVAVAKGLWVAWQGEGSRNVSRVRDLSTGGVFIQTPLAVEIGTEVELLFALPEGETRINGIVRYADGKNGIGVEFTSMGTADRARVQELLRRLKR